MRAVGGTFLAVQRDRHAAGLAAGGLDHGDGFAHRGACGNDVIDDENASGHRRADGSRRVVDVSWVRSRRQEEFDLVPLMQYAIDRTDPAKPQGRFDVYDLPAPLRQRLTEGGADLSLVEVA